MRILVAGGKGFIGSAVVRHLIDDTDHEVVNVDKMTCAATESHVDRSIDGPDAFVRTNLIGTFTMLEVARAAGVTGFHHHLDRRSVRIARCG